MKVSMYARMREKIREMDDPAALFALMELVMIKIYP